MLQRIRDKSSGWVTKVIIGVIALLLSFTGFEAIMSSVSTKDKVAKVNGVEITETDLQNGLEVQRQELIRQFGSELDVDALDAGLLRQATLESLIARELQLQAAAKSGFQISQSMLDSYLLQTPQFQVDGQFDAARFDQSLQRLGYTRMQYRQALDQDLKLAQMQAGIAASEFITKQEAQAFAKLERQTRDFSYQILTAEQFKKPVSEQQIEQYYQENPERFNTLESATVEYLELNKAYFFEDIEVSDEELELAYNKEIANLVEQRQAAHILFAANDSASFAQAEEKAQAAFERLQSGEDFAELAKSQSDDAGSSADGGDLGFSGKGIYELPFESTLYRLQVGEVSAPVQTTDGWHLIKLLDVQKPDVPSFASLKTQLSEKLKQDRVEQEFVEARQNLESAVYEAGDLEQPAQDLGLVVKVQTDVIRDGAVEGLFANRQVLQKVFSTEVLDDGLNSEVIELDPETAVVVRVKEHHLPKLKPLAEVRTQIEQLLQQQTASEAAQAEGEARVAALSADKKRVQGSEWQVLEAAQRDQEGVPAEIVRAAFKQQRPTSNQPTFAGLALANGDYALIQLKGVGEVEQALDEEELAMFRNGLAIRKGRASFAAFTDQLQQTAKIKYYEN